MGKLTKMVVQITITEDADNLQKVKEVVEEKIKDHPDCKISGIKAYGGQITTILIYAIPYRERMKAKRLGEEIIYELIGDFYMGENNDAYVQLRPL